MLLAGVQPGTYPRGGSVHLRLWFAERLAEASGAREPRRAPWMVYFARALGATDRPRCRSALTAAGHRHAPLGHRCCRRTRGGPVRALDRRRRRSTSVRSRSATTPPSAPARRCCPARSSAGTPSSSRDRACWTRSRTASTGPVRPRSSPGRRTTRGRPNGRRAGRAGSSIYGITSVLLAGTAAGRAGGRTGSDRVGPSADTHRLGAGGARPRCCGHRSRRWPRCAVFAAAHRGRRPAAVDRAGRGLPPGAQPRRLAAVGHRATDGLRAHLPVPALRQPAHAGVAATARRQSRQWHRDLHRAADPEVHRRSPTARSSPTTPWSPPTSSAAAGSTSAKTKVGKRAFLGNSGMTHPGRRVPEDGLVAVLSAAPRRRRPARRGWAARRCGCAAPPTEADAARTFDPPLRLKMMRASVETLPAGPGHRHRSGSALAVLGGTAGAGRTFGIWLGGAGAAGWCCWSRARSPAASPSPRNGLSSAGSGQ